MNLGYQWLAGAIIIVITWIILFSLEAIIRLLVTGILTSRDALRDRYFGGRWRPRLVDTLGVPTWIGLELAGLALALIAGLLIISLANSARDWWHKGDRSH